MQSIGITPATAGDWTLVCLKRQCCGSSRRASLLELLPVGRSAMKAVQGRLTRQLGSPSKNDKTARKHQLADLQGLPRLHGAQSSRPLGRQRAIWFDADTTQTWQLWMPQGVASTNHSSEKPDYPPSSSRAPCGSSSCLHQARFSTQKAKCISQSTLKSQPIVANCLSWLHCCVSEQLRRRRRSPSRLLHSFDGA